MAAFNIQEALIWKEKIESVIDQVCPILLSHPVFAIISVFLEFISSQNAIHHCVF